MATQIVESYATQLSDRCGALKVEDDPEVQCLLSDNCHWVGTSDQILVHCKQYHPENIWWNGEKERAFTVHDISKPSSQTELVVAYSHLFWLHIKNDTSSNHLYAACQHIATNHDDPHCKFMVRTEMKDQAKLLCTSCSTETAPHTEDTTKIFAAQNCTVRSLKRLNSYVDENKDVTLTVNISKVYYYD